MDREDSPSRRRNVAYGGLNGPVAIGEGGGHLEMDTSVSPDGSAVVVIAIPLRLLFTELRRVQTIGFTLGDLRGMREAFDKVIRFLESPAARSNHLPHDN